MFAVRNQDKKISHPGGFFYKILSLISGGLNMTNIEYIKKSVSELLKNNSNGHDDKHVFRVYDIAMKFCDEIPSANRDLVAVAALLHDCDDYKLFGEESARLLTNTRQILSSSGYDDEFIKECINIVKTIGYNKRLAGIQAHNIEGAIVSDADMCDASGAIGIIRCIEFGRQYKTKFFDSKCLPTDLDIDKYKNINNQSPSVNHFFDKLLRLRDMCLTNPGRKYANKKHQVLVNFLDIYFNEVNAPQIWHDLLSQYK